MPRDTPLSVRMPAPLREQLTTAAQAERRSVGNLVRLLVEDGLLVRRLQGLAFDEWHRTSREGCE